MNRDITRRDFINGAAAASLAGTLPSLAAGAEPSAYPPMHTGLGGNRPGSFETAHQLVWNGRTDWGDIADRAEGDWDLVVVGAGISGLAAAFIYRQAKPDARVLILDNNEDFGGHAVRNEFVVGGRTLLGYGGAQSLEEPSSYNEPTRQLLRDIGVDTDVFYEAYDREFFRRHGLAGATYFDKASYGVDRLVPYALVDYTRFLPMARGRVSPDDAVRQMPLGDRAKRELARFLSYDEDRLAGIPAAQQEDYLWSTTYRDFLARHMGITDPEIFRLFSGLPADATCSIERASAMEVMSYVGLPGLHATALRDEATHDEPYIFHFPDGNASIARLLVRKLMPRVAGGTSMEDVLLARFDYGLLDEPGAAVRLRLGSTVVSATHDGTPDDADFISITYVKDGGASRVRARHCIMAGYSAMLPAICPALPAGQKAAQARAIRAPILYTTVVLNNWRAFASEKVGFFAAPGAYHAVAMLDFPVSLGEYRYSADPDEPIVVHLERFAIGDDPLASPAEQRLNGRRELYATTFADIERQTRMQLAGALGGGGFDPARDIEAIVANRWGHGYAMGFESDCDEDGNCQDPHVTGRQRFGRIAIAGSDAGASAYIGAAVEQAHRAVHELL